MNTSGQQVQGIDGSPFFGDVVSGKTSITQAQGMTVVQDGVYLKYGSKMRAYDFFRVLRDKGFHGVVTTGNPHGYSQVAVAWGCARYGLKCTIFTSKLSEMTPMSRDALKLGVEMHEVGDGIHPVGAKELEDKAREYSLTNREFYFVPSGLHDPDFIRALSEGIMNVRDVHGLNPKNVWVAGGSGVVATSLAKVFPKAKINIVQVSNPIRKDILVGINSKIWIYPKELGNISTPAVELPPFQALSHYDAKVWHFAKRHGAPGDLIWVVK